MSLESRRNCISLNERKTAHSNEMSTLASPQLRTYLLHVLYHHLVANCCALN